MKILEHAKKNKIIAEIKKDQPEYADKMIKKGFQLVTIGTDPSLYGCSKSCFRYN